LLILLIGLAGVLLWFSIPADTRHSKAQPSFLTNLSSVMKSPAARATLAFTLLSCVANEMINLVFGVWMEDSFGLRLAALGAAAAVLGIAELSGEGLVAVFTDRIGKRRAIILGLAVNCLATLALPFTEGSLTAALVALFFFYVSFEFMIVSSIPLMTEVMPGARATMMSGFFTTASIGRALASAVAAPLYALGFVSTIIAAVAFNLSAIWAIRELELPTEGGD
jgi:predicted MFS family arabinose efflux permease